MTTNTNPHAGSVRSGREPAPSAVSRATAAGGATSPDLSHISGSDIRAVTDEIREDAQSKMIGEAMALGQKLGLAGFDKRAPSVNAENTNGGLDPAAEALDLGRRLGLRGFEPGGDE